MADREVEEALAHSFLARLPPRYVTDCAPKGSAPTIRRGTTVYRAGSASQAALVVRGLLRVFLMSAEGRQVTVRYARPGDVLGIAVLVGGPASTSVQAVEPSSVFRIRRADADRGCAARSPGLLGDRRGAEPAPV